MKIKKYLFILLATMQWSCQCEYYDSSICKTCYNNTECIDGFCVCNPSKYWTIGRFCYEKIPTAYFGQQLPGSCFANEIVLDSLRTPFGQYYISWERPGDEGYMYNASIYGYYFKLSDRDSFRMTSPTITKSISDTACQAFFYGTVRNPRVDLVVKWQEFNNINHVMDSCSYVLFREKL